MLQSRGFNEDIPVFVSLVKQNTYIEINEEGSEASAATVVGMETSSGLEPEDYGQFYLNHPFLYFIKEESTGTIIFIGQINNL